MPTLSRYNHFQPWQDGYYIAYNALSGAVALMTEENYAVYRRLVGKLNGAATPDLSEEEAGLLKQLEYGAFVRSDGVDERALLRFNHNIARYDRTTLGFVIAPTMACNMACVYCFENKTARKMSPEVMAAIVSYVEKRARSISGLQIDWYGGEPLLALDVIESLTASFVEMGEKHQFEYSSSMISNGYLLTAETVDRLVALKIRHVQITLDGPARIHNVKRPLKNKKESFYRILENLKYASTKLSVGIRVNVDKSFTIDMIEELLAELTAAGLRERAGVYFGMVEPSSQVCANIAESCYETADFSAIEVDYYRLLLARGFRIDKLPSPVAVFCMAQSTNAHLVDPDGNLYRCWNHAGDAPKAYGTITDEINYLHPNFQRLFSGDPFDHALCVECELLPICMGGCPARRADRQLAGTQMCEAWKHNLQPMLEIIARSKQQEMARRQQQEAEAQAAEKESTT